MSSTAIPNPPLSITFTLIFHKPYQYLLTCSKIALYGLHFHLLSASVAPVEVLMNWTMDRRKRARRWRIEGKERKGGQTIKFVVCWTWMWSLPVSAWSPVLFIICQSLRGSACAGHSHCCSETARMWTQCQAFNLYKPGHWTGLKDFLYIYTHTHTHTHTYIHTHTPLGA